MADVRLIFTLSVDQNHRANVIAVLQGNEIAVKGGINVLEVQDVKGSVICFVTLPEDDVKQAVNTCSWISNLKGVVKMQILVKPDVVIQPKSKDWKVILHDSTEWLKAVPLIPMTVSALVTFFIVYTAIDQIQRNLDYWAVFKLAGIPAFVAFLTQFGHEYYQWWRERHRLRR